MNPPDPKPFRCALGMTRKGSVLIVVLGLLAILAVVGIAFVTMSGIERNSAANFAIQAQFDLAADSAVDYVCHHLAWDLWDWDPATRTSAGRLLNYVPPGSNPPLFTNEPYDYPGDLDPWLATTLTSATDASLPGFHYSYDAPATAAYGLTFWGRGCIGRTDSDGPPDNLGFPTSNPPGNGLWIPELAFPYDRGLIRISLTVQDHNALMNLNAHGNNVSGSSWALADAIGKGYFISDVSPANVTLSNLLLTSPTSGSPPGLWGPDSIPGNPYAGAALLENPSYKSAALGTTGVDSPLTLDEEFALRKLAGTPGWTDWARLANVLSDTYQNRMLYTCVGWTSEVRGDGNAETHLMVTGVAGNHIGQSPREWSRHKFDLNGTVSSDNEDRTAEWLCTTLSDGRVMSNSARAKQLAVNILAFRDRTPSFKYVQFEPPDGPIYVGARRQPLFTKVSAKNGGTSGGITSWDVKVKVYNPWTGKYANDSSTDSTFFWKVIWDVNLGSTVSPYTTSSLPQYIIPRTYYPINTTLFGTQRTIKVPGSSLSAGLKEIRLEVTVSGKTIVLDRIDTSEIQEIENLNDTKRRYRPIRVADEEEWRGGNDPTKQQPITVLYVNDWKTTGKNFTDTEEDYSATRKIPIRFPHSVDKTIPLPLPPRSKTGPFLAFLRVGDLNQVLCPKDDLEPFWPWVPRVAKASGTPDLPGPEDAEKNLKFNWAAPDDGSGFLLANAANVFAVICPWSDGIDNDGDGKTDSDASCPDPDKGKFEVILTETEDLGRFGGPELRVAGKINLNTATDETLTALAGGVLSGTSVSGTFAVAVKNLRSAGPIKSVALLLQNASFQGAAVGPDAKGWMEPRDLAFTRISNIATVRSDTFSIYGTVQYIEPNPSGSSRLIKSRRFWALVDRSPCLAYNPTGSGFIRPRILNFQ